MVKQTTAKSFEGEWKIESTCPGEDGTFSRLPMRTGDRITIRFTSDVTVSFSRNIADRNDAVDPCWAEVTGVYSPKTGEIVGQIIDDNLSKTEFLIKASQDDRGNQTIVGSHRHNPGDGDWTGGGRTGG
ncbi:MAG: hypothetical protein AAGC71_01285 [Pseudomonadota bacterium]